MPGLIVGIDQQKTAAWQQKTCGGRAGMLKNTPLLAFMRCEASAGNANGPRAACGKAGGVVAVAPRGWQ